MVSHYHGLGFSGALEGLEANPEGTGFAVHEKFVPRLLAAGQAKFIGMKELARTYL
jgi:hypothetical protein